MIKAIVWNPEKVAMVYKGMLKSDTFEALRELENFSKCAYSTTLEVNDQKQLNEFITCVADEADLRLEYRIIKQHRFYRANDYISLEAAQEYGVTYTFELPDSLTEKQIADFAEFIAEDVLGMGKGRVGYACR